VSTPGGGSAKKQEEKVLGERRQNVGGDSSSGKGKLGETSKAQRYPASVKVRPGMTITLRGGRQNRYCRDFGPQAGVKCTTRYFVKKANKFLVVRASRRRQGAVALQSKRTGKYCVDRGRVLACGSRGVPRNGKFEVVQLGRGLVGLRSR